MSGVVPRRRPLGAGGFPWADERPPSTRPTPFLPHTGASGRTIGGRGKTIRRRRSLLVQHALDAASETASDDPLSFSALIKKHGELGEHVHSFFLSFFLSIFLFSFFF